MVKKSVPFSDAMLTAGIDIGYAATKCVSSHNSIIFPSICGLARRIEFQADEICQKYPGEQLVDDEGKWFVGNLALAHLPTGEQLKLQGRTSDEEKIGNVFRVRMAKVALGKLLPGYQNGDAIHVRLATGLPVAHLQDSVALKAALSGKHHILSDTTDVVVNVTDVICMPQPAGCVYSHTLTESGDLNKYHTYKRVGVLDVGNFTIDVTLDEQGEYKGIQSGSTEGGVFIAHERIAAVLESEYHQKMSFGIIDEVLRTRRFRARGKVISCQEVVEEALEPLRNAAINLMSQLWQTGIHIDVIYVSGGGASLVFDAVAAVYPQACLVPNAQFANARGYLNYALYSAKQKSK